MRKYRSSLFLVLAIAILAACGGELHAGKAPPRAIEGVLDLSDWDFEEDGVVRLNGEWEFYWEQLLESGDFSGERQPARTGFYRVPSLWNDYPIEGKKFPGDGYATFRLKVELGDPQQVHALRIMVMSTAYRIWVDGVFLASNGQVGTSPETSIPQSLPQTVIFRPDGSTADIVLQISNFAHRKGGFWDVVELGVEKQIHQKQKLKQAYEGFLFGSLLIMAFYHFGLFGLRRKDPSTLYFGLFCLLIGARVLVTGECFLIVFFPDFDWEVAFKIEYLSFYLGVPLFTAFIGS
ncbi:MAG: 7TM-DISM domain-containing protein, partial [Gemmatimonadetes bacterium]|nr:7TM-DISM domain-containing protein [Gemmatimonadota bacterium]